MADRDPDLTDADRSAIAAIRRELDTEFGPLEAAGPLDLREDPRDADDAPLRLEDAGREWSSRPGAVAGFVAGLLIGTLLGGGATLMWLHASPDAMAFATRQAAVSPQASASPRSTARPARDVGLDAASLREALDEWIDATSRGDVPAQMRFYPRRVPVYYMGHDVPRDTVRADKQKLFADATRLAISTGRPTVDLARDGGTAVTRFRTRYLIEGPEARRKAEVLQELRWERTDRGWVIVSERDARVRAGE